MAYIANETKEDFLKFHAAHFSSTSVDHFAEDFLGPVDDEEYAAEVEDDGLGYYNDGVKRTLTDEQIAIFRHSEIQALLRARRHAEEAKEDEYESPAIEDVESTMDRASPLQMDGSPAIALLEEQEDLDDGEINEVTTPQSTNTPSAQSQSKKKNKRKKKNNQNKVQRPPPPRGFFKQNVKPDLRKRTWDKVDAGLGNLDYDEDSSGPAPTHTAQRRRISYDDD